MKKNKRIIYFILMIILLALGLVACDTYEVEDVVKLVEKLEEVSADKSLEVTSTEETNSNNTDNIDNIENKTVVDGDMEVYFLDVGQGDSIFIKAPKGESILIDGGDKKYGDYIVSFLKELGVENIDILIATHPHADHIGGLIAVLENFNIKSVYTPKVTHTTNTYEEFVLGVQRQGLKFKEAKSGVALDIEGVTANFVGPADDYSDDFNNWSAVLRIAYGDTSFLFTGDAEKKSEHDIMLSGENIQASVLKLGHHGSDTSTSDEFIDEVNPKYAVVSVGEGNKYGHPNDDILQKLKDRNIELYRTDLHGNIVAISDGNDIDFYFH